MARLFAAASTEYLRATTSPVSGEPLTLAAWFYTASVAVNQTVLSVGDVSDIDYHSIEIRGTVGGDPLRAKSFDGGSNNASSTSAVLADTWMHSCAVFAASNNRTIYLDGGNSANNTASRSVTSTGAVAVGVTADNTPALYMDGRVAEAGIWNVALTAAEAAILAKGYSPLFVRPQSLVAYWPLIRDEDQDRVGGFDLTAFNTPSIAAHPPIIYPAPALLPSILIAAIAGQPFPIRPQGVPTKGMRDRPGSWN